MGRAFEEEGYCVVRGPDRLWGGDIKRFHPPAGVFEGVIGGPPCQQFSALRFINKGKPMKWGNLIPEFERVVSEAQPDWFVMENIKAAPPPSVDGYKVDGSLLNNRWLGGSQNRVHRFSFGTKNGAKLVYDVVLFESPEWAARVCASGSQKPGANRHEQNKLRFHGWKTASGLRHSLILQGLPEDLLDDAPFTLKGKHGVIGNAVAMPLARALAKAVRGATSGFAEKKEVVNV
ncbi:hypothetical protein ES703_110124 [subsurface metagenome]